MQERTEIKKECKSCMWRRWSKRENTFICVADDSTLCGEEVKYNDYCPSWEEKRK